MNPCNPLSRGRVFHDSSLLRHICAPLRTTTPHTYGHIWPLIVFAHLICVCTRHVRVCAHALTLTLSPTCSANPTSGCAWAASAITVFPSCRTSSRELNPLASTQHAVVRAGCPESQTWTCRLPTQLIVNVPRPRRQSRWLPIQETASSASAETGPPWGGQSRRLLKTTQS